MTLIYRFTFAVEFEVSYWFGSYAPIEFCIDENDIIIDREKALKLSLGFLWRDRPGPMRGLVLLRYHHGAIAP